MKNSLFFFVLLVFLACNSATNPGEASESNDTSIERIVVERYTIQEGNLDSLRFSGFIEEFYDKDENQTKSIYFSTDSSIMMQFVNRYENGNKVRVNWVNAQDSLVQYVKNEFDGNSYLIISKTFSTDDEYQYGFQSRWKENGRIEEKGPIEEGKPFKPNAVYQYNEQDEFLELREFDANDSLYAVVKWNYLEQDERGNWIERTMMTNDTINRLEKRIIEYRSPESIGAASQVNH